MNCPIVLIAQLYEVKCMERNCAWWDEISGKCAINSVAKALEMINAAIRDLTLEIGCLRQTEPDSGAGF